MFGVNPDVFKKLRKAQRNISRKFLWRSNTDKDRFELGEYEQRLQMADGRVMGEKSLLYKW